MNVRFFAQQLELQSAAAPVRPQGDKAQAARQHGAAAAGNTELTAPENIDNKSGMRQGLDVQKRTLAQRMVATRTGQPLPRYVPLKRSRNSKTDKKEEEQEDFAFLAPVLDTLYLLEHEMGNSRQQQQQAREALDQQLSQFFEPFQRYQVLLEASARLSTMEMDDRLKKLKMKNALTEMMSELIAKQPHEFRRALQASDEMANAVEAMVEENPASLRDLRFLIGAKANGNIDTPLSAATVGRALFNNFGNRFEYAIDTLSTRMVGGTLMQNEMRKNPTRSMGRYWLTMADSQAFTLVRSALDRAKILLVELSKINLRPKVEAVEMMVMMLTAAEAGWGKGKAAQLIPQIIDVSNASDDAKAMCCRHVHDAYFMLPLVLWSQDKMSARRELLDELIKLIPKFQARMPANPSKEEIREQGWRGEIAERRKNEALRRQ